jgi:hypothetical protein
MTRDFSTRFAVSLALIIYIARARARESYICPRAMRIFKKCLARLARTAYASIPAALA